jgi:hypothetical protein
MAVDTDRAGSGISSWRTVIDELARIRRPSASPGEREAAEVIARRLRELGCRTTIEEERAHGGYWWPLGLANALAGAGAVWALRRRGRTRRAVAGVAGGLAAAAIWDDVSGGRLWFRRRFLPHRPTWNVVAEAGDPDAERTIVLVAHHDAAHSGLVFHPALGRIGMRIAPELQQRVGHTFPIMYLVWGSSVLLVGGAAAGSRRLLGAALLFATGSMAAMTDIGLRDAVPGANDNLSAVAVMTAVAESLRDRPLQGVRLLLVSTGSEESFMEGMQAFARRHFSGLDPEHTEVLCLECLGGPDLLVLEGEGMLRMRDYTWWLREELAQAADRAGVEVRRGLRTVAATDGLIALRAGYPTVTLASIDETNLPLNYHWPSDTPDALYWETIEDAVAVCESFVRGRAAKPA